MTQLTPQVREALEATLEVAKIRHLEARNRREKYGELYDRADREEYAAQQTIDALVATLDEPEPPAEDKYKTFGED